MTDIAKLKPGAISGDAASFSVCLEDRVTPSPIPPLYEPVLLGFFTFAFRLRGFEPVERGTSSFGVVQEWHCELP